MPHSRPKLESSDESLDLRQSWNRRHDFIFLALTLSCLLLAGALVTYDPNDPSWSTVGSAGTQNAVGQLGALIADLLFHAIGVLAFALPILILLKLRLIFRLQAAFGVALWSRRLTGLSMTLLGLSSILEISVYQIDFLPAGAGGIVGYAIANIMVPFLGLWGAAITLIMIVGAGLMLYLEFSWLDAFEKMGGLAFSIIQRVKKEDKSEANSDSDVALNSVPVIRSVEQPLVEKNTVDEKSKLGLLTRWFFWRSSRSVASSTEASKAQSADAGRAINHQEVQERIDPAINIASSAADTIPSDKSAPDAVFVGSAVPSGASQKNESIAKSTSKRKSNQVQKTITTDIDDIPIEPLEKRESKTSDRAKRDLQGSLFKQVQDLPSIALLDPANAAQKSGFSAERLRDLSQLLVQKLSDFGVKIEVTAVAPGPVITRFEIQPAPGVKASKISNLARDLARSMAMIAVRVVEVIPGKSVMGIEVPNEDRAVVSLSEVLSSEDYDKSKSPLTLALGHDIGGNPVITDLAKMPHLLVAGTTGSGKSVGVNAMLLSLLFKSTPEQLRLILVDPKMLELSVYEGIPHLLTPVITDMKEAANGLRWSVAEMERRYQLMAALGVRNVAGYNKKVSEAIEAGTPIPDPLWQIDQSYDTTPPTLEPLPYIVIVIDEFADMMMMVGKKVEELIARIAQKARAAGIHMILATQRPSVDVITGLIKANVPTRIAFQVSSKIDSRTILDQGGAEQLLGHGDMLYMPPGNALPERVHGAFVDDDEVHRLVAEWKKRGEPNYIEEITQASEGGEGLTLEAGDEQDDLYDQAVAFVTETNKCSISSVQRKLRIGYNRAARLVETMEAAGVVSPPAHNGSREVIAQGAPR